MRTIRETETIRPLDLSRYRHLFLLTGAGISAASGLSTYRGPGGLWTQNDVARIADARNLPDSLPDLWRLYRGRREQALRAEPNAAHHAIATLQRNASSGQTVTLVTQNVDGLHGRAGTPQVVEMHGSAFRSRCRDPRCPTVPFPDTNLYDETPRCSVCGGYLRPDVVLFNESIPREILGTILRALASCDLFLAVGTSGVVAPAAEFVRGAASIGARTINVNVEPSGNPAFGEEYVGPAEVVLPRLFGIVTS
ncbi:MAG: Sir2 family NAD-dependent protein deacetylase [Capsulimonadales bacterium]|nr:Sir2 family NAD-dependent protein deacetylase [Capsulimonadales bacterium]